jgi:hypothetical protein
MILTKAIAGIARSGATRAGYPVLLGAKVPLYALSNVARSGATRSNYTSSNPFISVGGIDLGWAHPAGQGVIAASLTKSDAINNTPVTLAFTAYGWVPVEGADVIVTLGSKNNMRREFGGTILSTVHRYASKPVAQNMLYDVSCIDYTWGLDTKKVSGNYTRANIAAIAASLLTAAPGYTLRVEPDIGAEILDQITFTEQVLSSAFAQLAKRVGGDFLCDFNKVVHLFYTNTALTPPRIVNAVHPTLQTIQWRRDLSQVATRILGNFGGSNAAAELAPGATLLPVETAAWYLSQGGRVLVGQQRVTYGGLDAGGGGSLVGPGAAPTGALNYSLQPGAGVGAGAHDYAVTFKTAAGESLPGPRVTVAIGVFLPPTTAPTAGAPGPGPGPNQGVHDYAVSFVISTGETVPGPRVTAATDVLAAPTTAPIPDRVDAGPGPDPGPHDYAVSFGLTASGDTPTGPISGQITTGTVLTPVLPPTTTTLCQIGNHPGANVTFAAGSRLYCAVSFRTAGGGETTAGPSGSVVVPGAVPGTWAGTLDVGQIPLGPPGIGGRVLYFYSDDQGITTVYTKPIGDNVTTSVWLGANDWAPGNLYSTTGQIGPSTNTAGSVPVPHQTVHLSNLPRVPGTQGGILRRIYRRSGAAGGLRYLATIADNTTTTYTDTTPNASLGSGPPTGNAAVLLQIPLTKLPIGNALVTARKIYRTPANTGGGTLRLVTTIADNTTTTFLDTVPDGQLGAPALDFGTAQANQVQLSAIPLGAAAVVARGLYRTAAGASQLRALVTLADNTTTAYLDVKADAALGANAPTADTSGLQQPAGYVLAGSPTLPCATVAAFRPSGGWAIVASQSIRYTGISGNALLGIPTSGPGAILATIAWNTTVVAAPMLTGIPTTGIGVIKYPILKGDPVNVFVQVDNLDAQAALRAQLPGSDGVIEDEIQDGRLSYTEGLSRCEARLELLSAIDSDGKVGVITVSYVCRDINTVAGATVTVNLGPPVNVRGDFLIQRVGVARFNVPRIHPTYTVEASSLRFSAEEMLRLVRQGAL